MKIKKGIREHGFWFHINQGFGSLNFAEFKLTITLYYVKMIFFVSPCHVSSLLICPAKLTDDLLDAPQEILDLIFFINDARAFNHV